MDFDAVVVGSGAGGGTAAAELVRSGKHVLLVERGGAPPAPDAGRDERRMVLEREACEDRPVMINGRAARPLIGGVLGGSTALFGAALLRPGPSDFSPGRHYADHLPRELWEWPIDHAELSSCFDRAEDLYGVAGDHDDVPPHLGRRHRPYASALPPLEPISRRLRAGFESQGLAPFSLPLAIDFDRCLRCGSCPGFACPNGARSSSLVRTIEPVLRDPRPGALTLWRRCEAERLVVEGRRVRGIRLRFRDEDRVEEVRAGAYLLAAGAIGTPVVLLRSGLGGRSDQVGRNHMCHLGAVPVGLFAKPTGASTRFAKQLGLTDFYLGTEAFPHKLGYAQCIPVPGPLTIRKHLGFPIGDRAARWLHDRAVVFAGSVEDLPQPSNRVTLGRRGEIRLDRRFHRYDVARGRFLARTLARTLRRAGATVSLSTVARREHEHLAHQVGTCRFGRDPRTSVLDPQCRLHDHDDVYVVDGSFMPTSLGVGPALLIIANALRVASQVSKEH